MFHDAYHCYSPTSLLCVITLSYDAYHCLCSTSCYCTSSLLLFCIFSFVPPLAQHDLVMRVTASAPSLAIAPCHSALSLALCPLRHLRHFTLFCFLHIVCPCWHLAGCRPELRRGGELCADGVAGLVACGRPALPSLPEKVHPVARGASLRGPAGEPCASPPLPPWAPKHCSVLPCWLVRRPLRCQSDEALWCCVGVSCAGNRAMAGAHACLARRPWRSGTVS